MAPSSSPGHDLPSLLLLPAPPRPATRPVLHAAYAEPLTAVLTRLSAEHRARAASSLAPVLVVAVAGPVLARGPAGFRSRAVRWARAQALLADLYSVVASVCAERAIPSDLGGDEPGTVDARVVLVDHGPRAPAPSRPKVEDNCTPVLDLAAFAATVYPWRTLFHASGDPGYELLAAYLAAAEGPQKLLQSQIVVVEGGLSLCNSTPAALEPNHARETRASETAEEDDATEGYGTVCLGGTFDHLHPGHKLLLHASVLLLRVPDAEALEAGGKPCVLIVGISGDELLVKKKYAEELQSWETRARSVISFLATALNSPTTDAPEITKTRTSNEADNNNSSADASTGTPAPVELHATFRRGAVLVRCVDIRDPFGPTIAEEPIDAIVVSGETRAGGQAINERREARRWRALDIYEIDVLDAHTNDDENDNETNGDVKASAEADRFAAKISSTEIRRQRAEARSRR